MKAFEYLANVHVTIHNENNLAGNADEAMPTPFFRGVGGEGV